MIIFKVNNPENPPPPAQWFKVEFDENDEDWHDKKYILRD